MMDRLKIQTYKRKAIEDLSSFLSNLQKIKSMKPIAIKNAKMITELILISSLIVFGIDYLLNNNPVPENIRYGLYSSDNNARYILSALCQAQAAIFGIFFTLSLIISQIQVQSRAISPYAMKKMLKSNTLRFIFVTFLISITLDMLLLRYVDQDTNINISLPLILSVFATLLLLLCIYNNLTYVFDDVIQSEIAIGEPRRNLRGADLRNTIMGGTNLSFVDLSGAHLENSNLVQANLSHTTLNKAHLEGARMRAANLNESQLISANFEGADLPEARMGKALIMGANLRNTILENARLESANLSASDLTEAKLKGANLRLADLSLVKLTGADMEGAELDGAKLMPIEFDDPFLDTVLKAKNLDNAEFVDLLNVNLLINYFQLNSENFFCHKLEFKINELLKAPTPDLDIEYLKKILDRIDYYKVLYFQQKDGVCFCNYSLDDFLKNNNN